MVTDRVVNIGREAIRLISLVLLLGFLQQCGGEMPAEYETLFRLPSHEREAKFKQFPIEKQVDVYIYAMYVEPPKTEFLRYLASNGEKAVPFLLARLEIEKSDTRKAILVNVFEEIHRYYASLRNDEATITVLERIVSNMKDDYNRKKAEESVAVVKNTPGFEK